jgi:hypothetical protein
MAILRNTIIEDGLIQIPSGTTAQRPASPQVGMLRFNTTTNRQEYYNGTSWINVEYSFSPTVTGAVTTIDYGGYRIHGFTGAGTFVANNPGSIDVLLVAGGGGGGSSPTNNNDGCGGGGAGGIVFRKDLLVSAQTYTIAVGYGEWNTAAVVNTLPGRLWVR